MRYIIGNWKMHATVNEAVALAGAVEDGVIDLVQGGKAVPAVLIAAPFTVLTAVNDVLDERVLHLAAQNAHWEDQGDYTGEISPSMLRDLAPYVMVGHSERRAAGDTDQIIAKKLAAVVRAGLTPVLFVGEAEPSQIATEEVVGQLQAALQDVDPSTLPKLLVAYQPQWAEAEDTAVDDVQLKEVLAELRTTLEDLRIADGELLYGGGVTADNAADFNIPELNGLVVSKPSLDAGQFIQIVSATSR